MSLPVSAEAAALERAMALAIAHRYDVAPNPPAGCVIMAASGAILGEGAHRRQGGRHAEEEALEAAGPGARGGVAVVTMEPCAAGAPGKRRPGCADLLLRAGVARVVYAAADPGPHGSGRGVAALRAAGVDVERMDAPLPAVLVAGIRRCAAGEARPWTVAKWAMSLDGRTADARGGSRWITGAAARERAHVLRAGSDAVIVGARTAALDDPDLRPRGEAGGTTPLRVVVDGALRLTPGSRLASTAREAPVLVATRACPAGERVAALHAAGVEVIALPGLSGGVDLGALLANLRGRGCRRVLLEGGGDLAAGFFRERLVDQVAAFIAPVLLGGRAAPGPVAGAEGLSFLPEPLRLDDARTTLLGEDVMVEGFVPAAR